MAKLAHAAALSSAILIAACASNGADYEVAASDADVPDVALVAPPSDLSGTVVRAASVDGSVVNRIHFSPDGIIHIVPEDGRVAIPGTYAVRNDNLCLTWTPRGTECWPYREAFRQGEPVTLTSDLGQMAVVTLVSGTAMAGPPVEAPQPVYQAPAPAPAPAMPPATRRAGERG